MEDEPNLSAQRAAEKQQSREEDRRRLQAGEVTVSELRAENSFFSPQLGVKIVDFGRAPRRLKKP